MEVVTRLQILLLILFGLALFGNILASDFVYYDELTIICDNQFVTNLNNLHYLADKNYFNISGEATYRPLVTLTYFLDYHLYKLEPFGYHLTDLCLHIICGILVFFIGARIFRNSNLGLLAGFLFMAHPVVTEVVNCPSFREDSLCALFMLWSFLLYLQYQDNKRMIYCVFSYVIFTLALFSKEMAVMLPAIIYLYERTLIRDKTGYLKDKYFLGYLAVLFGYILVQFWFMRNIFMPNIKYMGGSLVSSLLNTVIIIADYLKTILWPQILCADRTHVIPKNIFNYKFLFSLSFLCLIFLLMIKMRKIHKIGLFGISWFFLTLAPVANIIPIFNPSAERYLYLPMAGLVFSGVYFWAGLYKNKKILSLLLITAILAGYSARTLLRNQDWADPILFWEKTARLVPYSPRAHNALGFVYQKYGYKDKAKEEYKKTISMLSNFTFPYINLSNIYAEEGNYVEAAKYCKAALKFAPDEIDLHYNLAGILMCMNKPDEAISEYEKVLTVNPTDYEAWNNIGLCFAKKGEFRKAVNCWLKSLEVAPGNIYARNYLAELKQRAKKLKK